MFYLVARIMAAYKVILVWGKTSMHISINQVKPVTEMSSSTRMVTLSAMHSIISKTTWLLQQSTFLVVTRLTYRALVKN